MSVGFYKAVILVLVILILIHAYQMSQMVCHPKNYTCNGVKYKMDEKKIISISSGNPGDIDNSMMYLNNDKLIHNEGINYVDVDY